MAPDTPASETRDQPPHIVPRWEWRTFGEAFPEAERTLTALEPERAQESDEVYILSAAANGSAKFRDGVMDVKRLEQVDEHGLELWRPVAKAEVPFAAADVRRLLAGLGVPVPELARPDYTLQQFIADLVEPEPLLQAVAVHKRRTHFTFEGCMTELTEMRTAQRSTRSIAVESPDRERIVGAVRALGLDGRPNVSVPRGLGALVGLGARRFAVIDVGTNSVKFHVGERALDGAWRTVVDRAEVTRLGEGLGEGGPLGAEPIARTVAAIEAMARGGRAARRRDHRRRRHRLDAERHQQRGPGGGRARPHRSRGRGRVRRRGGAARLPGRAVGARRRRRGTRGVRHRRRQLAVHLRRRRADRRALQRQRRRRAVHRAVRARRPGVAGDARRGPHRDRRGPRAPRRPPCPGRGRRHGRRGDEPHGGAPRAGDLRPRRRGGDGAGGRRDRPPDRALPHPRPPTSGARSWACSRSARRSSSPVPASCAPSSSASARRR